MRLGGTHGAPSGKQPQRKRDRKRHAGRLDRHPQRTVIDPGEKRPQALEPGGLCRKGHLVGGYQARVIAPQRAVAQIDVVRCSRSVGSVRLSGGVHHRVGVAVLARHAKPVAVRSLHAVWLDREQPRVLDV